MRTLRRTLTLLLIPAGAVGCSSLPKTPPSTPPKITTVAAVGDQPRPVVSGIPGNSVTADVEVVDDRASSRDRLSGRVVDPRGRPVAGALVQLAIDGTRTGRTARVTTDEAGRFTLHGLRPGVDYAILAESEDAQGRILSGRTRARVPGTDLQIALARSGRAGDSAQVNSISDRHEADEADSPRVNEEDLPPAKEADDFEYSERRRERVASETARSLTPGQVWRRGGNEPGTPSSVDRDDPPTRTAPDGGTAGGSLEDDGPNPLPPALEAPRERASAPANDHFESAVPGSPRTEAPGRQGASPPARGSNGSEEAFTSQADPPRANPTLAQTASSAAATDKAAEAETKASVIEATAPEPPPTTSETITLTPEPRPADTPIPSRGSPSPTGEPKASDGPPPMTEPAGASAAGASPPPAEPAPGTQAATPARGRPTWGDLAPSNPAAAAGVATARPAQPGRPRLSRAQRNPSANAARPAGSLASCQYDAKTHRLLDFQLPDLQGNPVRLQDLDADFVLIDFWGSWCAPCLNAIPHLVEIQKQFNSGRLKVVGVAVEDAALAQAAKQAGDAANRLGINYPILLSGADGQPCPLQSALHIQAFPTMILVDRHGRILWREQGATPLSLARLDRVIASTVNPDVVRR